MRTPVRHSSLTRATWWVAGLTTAERAHTLTPPPWARFVAAALAADQGRHPAAWSGWEQAFARPLRPLVDATMRACEESAPWVRPAVLGELDRWLSDRLVRTAARVFVHELDVARRAGLLVGTTPEGRFACFVSWLRDGGLGELLERYPVLARLLGQMCVRTADACVELFGRLVMDRPRIVADLLGGVDPGEVVSIDPGRGDVHCGGRAVMVLTFADGARVVYKPRDLRLHRRFAELVAWFDGVVPGAASRVPACVTGPGYGWVEYVDHRPCEDLAGVDRFYHRQGALLALLHAIGAADLHAENIVAAGDQPVVVDIETLFHPTLSAARVTPDPAVAALEASVMRVSLLPRALVGENGAFDISGFGGGAAGTFAFDGIGWQDAGTDRMRLLRQPVRVPATRNRPVLAAAEVDPREHGPALLAGFHAGYRSIVDRRVELIDRLTRMATAEIRVLVRPTITYAILLEESTHPSVLGDADDRERVLDTLVADSAADPVRGRLQPHEAADLRDGEVPLFVSTTASTDVSASTGLRETGVLGGSGVRAAIDRIAGMGDRDRRRQQWLIRAALATSTGPVDHHGGAPAPVPHTRGGQAPLLLDLACGLADRIVAAAEQDRDRVNWLGLELVDDRHWAILPMGAGLGSGYGGVALFLAELGRRAGRGRYVDVASRAVSGLPRLVAHLTARPELAAAAGTGAFDGLGGVAYTLIRLAALLGDDGLRDCAVRTVELMDTIGDEPRDTSLAAGLAGGLAAAVAVGRETGSVTVTRLADRLADRLATQLARGRVTGGFLGDVGAGWALLRHAEDTGDRRHAALGRRIVLAGLGGPVGPTTGHGWCTGTAGRVLAALALDRPEPAGPAAETVFETVAEPAAGTVAAGRDRLLATLIDRRPVADLSLCHGELGIADVLTAVAHQRPTDEIAACLNSSRQAVTDSARLRCGTPGGVPTAGLLSGWAGLGYGLLRLECGRQVPSVLTLETRASA